MSFFPALGGTPYDSAEDFSPPPGTGDDRAGPDRGRRLYSRGRESGNRKNQRQEQCERFFASFHEKDSFQSVFFIIKNSSGKCNFKIVNFSYILQKKPCIRRGIVIN